MSEIDLSGLQELPDASRNALFEVMFLAAQADGEFSPEEKKEFGEEVQRLSGGNQTGTDLDTFLLNLEEDFFSYGRQKRLEMVKEHLDTPKLRQTALALAVKMVASDGIIRTSERELLLEVAEALEIDPGDAADMVKKYGLAPIRPTK